MLRFYPTGAYIDIVPYGLFTAPIVYILNLNKSLFNSLIK
jgi:hypothetical protein